MKSTSKCLSWIYGITLFFITLSGFAQMPIFKRYYIADIPGLGWLADFYATHLLHYLFAWIFICLITYGLVDLILAKRPLSSIGRLAMTRGIVIAGLILTGCLMVIKNFSGTPFSHGLIITLDLSHLMLCMALLAIGAFRLIKR